MKMSDTSRRHFLQTSAQLAACSVFGPQIVPATDEKPQKEVHRPSLGFSLYGMKTLPLETALRTCRETGYSHVEFTLNPGYPTEPAVFGLDAQQKTANLLKSLSLDLPCLMIQLSLTADETAHAKALELISTAGIMSHQLVPDRPPVLETILGGSPAKWDEQKTGMLEQLRDWAAAAEKANTTIAIKAHVSSAVNSPERLLWLLDGVQSDAIQVAYDYSHFELQGIDLAQSLKQLLPVTRFIHVKDTMGDTQKFQFLLPGEGRTDYVHYFRILRDLEYSGPVCVEVSGQIFNKPNYNPIAAARSSFLVLSTARNTVWPE